MYQELKKHSLGVRVSKVFPSQPAGFALTAVAQSGSCLSCERTTHQLRKAQLCNGVLVHNLACDTDKSYT